MSAFVLNRNYELQLPNSYVDVDREEMEYVDGGFATTNTWYGCSVTLNKSNINAIVDVMYGASWAGMTFSGYCWMISVGLAVPTLGMSVGLAGTISAISAFSSALVGMGAWAISHCNSLTIPLVGIRF